ncbi:MAG: glycosyltransferase family 2 protein [Rhodocyclaceae bacterium]
MTSAATGPLVTVIIPYFQRKPGILGPCVASILSQSGGRRVHVVVADDTSPVPAEAELERFAADRARITLVKRPNGGPGAARNTALDNVPADADYVALMDSDDAWEDGFLDAAVDALERGYDLFFADSKRYSNATSRFHYDRNPANNLRAEDHLVIDEARALFEFRGDFFDFLVRRSNILGPSTTVYRRAVAPDLRFREQFFNGQDRVFKLELGRHLGRVAFTPRVLGIEGEGINIFDSANWGTPKSISLLSSYIEMTKFILREIPLSEAQRDYVRRQLQRNRHSFAANLLHLMVKRDKINMEVVTRTFRRDPMTMLLLAPNLAKATLNKLTAR